MLRLAVFRLGVLLALAAPTALAVTGCDHAERTNLDPARELWATEGARIRDRTTELRTRQRSLAGRIGALAVPDGTEDAGLAAAIAELQGQVAGTDQVVAAVERALTQATGETELALSKPNKLAAKQLLDAHLATFETAADAARRALDELTPRVAAAEALMQGLVAGQASEVRRLENLAAVGGVADFSDIAFQPGTAELDLTRPASKATIGRLVGFARACDQLRFTLTGHTSREGKPAASKALSLARAEAVKAHLIAAGIAPIKIAGTAGMGATRMLVDEPAPGTPEEAAMPPDDLADRRRRNQRVTVEVTGPCTTPVAAPPTLPPPVPAEAVPPGNQRGTMPPTGAAGTVPVRPAPAPGIAPARPR